MYIIIQIHIQIHILSRKWFFVSTLICAHFFMRFLVVQHPTNYLLLLLLYEWTHLLKFIGLSE